MKRSVLLSGVVVVGVLAVIALLQWLPASGKYTVFPDEPQNGPLRLVGVSPEGVVSKGLLRIESPQTIERVHVAVRAHGEGTVAVGGVTLYDSTWKDYTQVASLDGVRVLARDPFLIVENSDASTIEPWLTESLYTGTGVADPHGLLSWKAFLATDELTDGVDLPYSFRGSHTYYLRGGPGLVVTIDKTDMNWYNGSDEFTVVLTDLASGVSQTDEIPDDGVDTKTDTAVAAEYVLAYPDIADSVYSFTLMYTGSGDDALYNISFSQGPVSIAKRMFTLAPITVNAYCPSCVLQAQTYHQPFVQNLTVDGERWEITSRATVYNHTIAGLVEVVIPKGDIVLSGADRYTVDEDFSPYIFERGMDIVILGDPAIPVTQENFVATLPVTGTAYLDRLTVTLS